MIYRRHYTAGGAPAYITSWATREGQPDEFRSIIYARTPGFEKLWDKATNWTEVVLDTP